MKAHSTYNQEREEPRKLGVKHVSKKQNMKKDTMREVLDFIKRDLARPAIIGVTLGLFFSFFSWIGVIIGGMIGGYMTTKYKVSAIVGALVGIISWPTVFFAKTLIYGYPAVKAFTITGQYVLLADIFGFVLALLSAFFGTAIKAVLEERRKRTFSATRIKITRDQAAGKS